jgi:hypothetical protein
MWNVSWMRGTQGLSGQCLMDPPDDESHFNPVPYMVGGSVANLAVGAALLLVLGWWDVPELEATALIVVAASNLLAALINLLPTHGSLLNDGTHLVYSLKSSAGRSALYRQLKINARMGTGARPKDVPEEFYVLPGSPAPGDPLDDLFQGVSVVVGGQ